MNNLDARMTSEETRQLTVTVSNNSEDEDLFIDRTVYTKKRNFRFLFLTFELWKAM